MIRAATPDDARAIAAVSVTAWRQAYAGLLPAELLAGLSTDQRAAGWLKLLDAPDSSWDQDVLVATQGGQVVGFVSHGRPRDDALREHGFDAEVMTLYVDPPAQGSGLGRALMVQAMRDLSARGHRSLALWTLRDNPRACAFYERLGGVPYAERAGTLAGHPVADIAYAWPSLATSLAATASTASATIGVGSRQ